MTKQNNQNLDNLAPIVLFVYNRLEHTQKTVEALQNNVHAEDSELFIFSDAAKDTNVVLAVENVRNYLSTIRGFKSITIIHRQENFGLARSIIEGVSHIVNQYGKIIVLEDDIVTSPYFLKFMNEALGFYQNKDSVWHINGWSHPISTQSLGDTYFWRTMDCWGWATWKNRWEHFRKEPEVLVQKFSLLDRYKFNIYGADNIYRQITCNLTGQLDTWAVFWYATIFIHHGYCLSPTQSLVRNIGFDGTGVNCNALDTFNTITLSQKDLFEFTDTIFESKLAVGRIKKFYKAKRAILPIRVLKHVSRRIRQLND